MRFAIVGVGNYGARFAARLMQARQDVTLIARGRTLERLRTQGLTTTHSTTTPAMPLATVRATDDPTSVGPVDVVCMCVKLYQLDDAMDVARPLVGPDTTILGLQNGVTAEDRLITRFGAAHVVGVGMGLASVPLAIGEFPHGTSARTRAIVQVFKEAGLHVVESANVLEAIWGKFIVICGNTVCAFARQPAGGVVQVPALRQSATSGKAGGLNEVEPLKAVRCGEP